jgi:DNA-binding transcriptional LysR family regulator
VVGDIELRDLRIFLALADELHFGRTAARLGISQSAVSEATRLLERRLGVRLFDRTSRRVALTPAGKDLLARLAPVCEALERVLVDARDAGKGVSGVLRIGCTPITLLPSALELAKAFTTRHPACEVLFEEVDLWDPYGPLRSGGIDVLVNWLAVDEPDLTAGPAIASYRRVLAVSRDHRLAARESVSLEDLVGEVTFEPPAALPRAILEAISPLRTPSGSTIIRRPIMHNTQAVAAVARGEMVHPTMEGIASYERPDLVLVPMRDMKPLPLGLIWRTSRQDARIAALADVVSAEGPWPVRGSRT